MFCAKWSVYASTVTYMCFSGLIISSRILWMNVSRLLPQFVSMYFGGFLAGFIGSVCLFVVSF